MVARFFTQSYLFYKGRRAAFNVEEFIGFQLFYPLVTLCFYCLIASYSFHTADLASWVIGNSFLMCVNSCIFGLGTVFMMERYTGRIRSIVASPCSKIALILANGVWPVCIAALTALLGLLAGSLVFHVDFSGINLGLVVLTVFCAMVSATCFGLFLAVIGLISDGMHMVLNVVSGLLMLFTGAEFPVEQLSVPGQLFSQVLPLTKSIKAMNLLFQGSLDGFAECLLLELVTGLVFALLAVGLFGFSERVARKYGTLDLF